MSANADCVCDYFEAYKFCRGIGTKYSKMDHVKFLKAVFHKFYLLHT